LVENIGLLPKEWTLDMGVCAKRNALYLLKMGFEVKGIDISAQAVDRLLNCLTSDRSRQKSRDNLALLPWSY
jgi:hypothetical protein